MALLQLSSCVFQHVVIIKGGKTPTFFRSMHWIFVYNAKKNPNEIGFLLDLE